uniref:Uncharacterized protein n=1 Tax=Arundo donax TaxID=35708 RepID=A0A0A9EKL0_ARUDO
MRTEHTGKMNMAVFGVSLLIMNFRNSGLFIVFALLY